MSWEVVAQALGVIGGLGVLGQFAGWAKQQWFTEDPGHLVIGGRGTKPGWPVFIDVEWQGDSWCVDVSLTPTGSAQHVSGPVSATSLRDKEKLSARFEFTGEPASVQVRYRLHGHKHYRVDAIDLHSGETYRVQGPVSWRRTGVVS